MFNLLFQDDSIPVPPRALPRLKVPPNGGRWSDQEHRLFLQGIEMYGKDWRRIARLVQSRTTVQTRSHAQKHFDRIEKERKEHGVEIPPVQTRKVTKPKANKANKAAKSALDHGFVQLGAFSSYACRPDKQLHGSPKDPSLNNYLDQTLVFQSITESQHHIECPPVRVDLETLLDDIPVCDFLALLSEKEREPPEELDFLKIDDETEPRLTSPTGFVGESLNLIQAPSISPMHECAGLQPLWSISQDN